jgi:branched-chain amino acid transport system substrate-binding protein
VRTRWLCLVALAAAPALAGCGTAAISGATNELGNQLTVYSSLPLQGASAAASKQIVNGEKLALAQTGGQIGPFTISYASLDDANPHNGEWDPGVTASNAKTAAQDNSAIAYLGDYNSAASAISLPLINAAGILQVSPASPYVGLTSAVDAGEDEPARFYPTGERTFGRLIPADPVEAAAEVALLRRHGVKRIYVLSDEDPFQTPLAGIVAEKARAAGITVLANEALDTKNNTDFSALALKVAHSGAQAMFFSGSPTAGAILLWRALYGADPHLWLLGSSALVNETFTAQIGAAAQNTYLATPLLPAGLYPPAAQRLFRAYRLQFHEEPKPYALYGYEAMSLVLLAIRKAGSHGNDREAVIKQFFGIRERQSVLGRFSIEPSGDTTIARYAEDRIAAGRPVFYAVFELPA